MVVGDDEVEAQTAGGFSLGEGSHAGVYCNDEADALGMGRFKDAGLQAVAFAETVGDVEAGRAAKHLDSGLEQDDGGGAVHVVVAVKENRLLGGDGALQPVNGHIHAQHEKWIVEVGRRRD